MMSERHRFVRRATLDVAELTDQPILVLRAEFGSHAVLRRRS
jgi:hypothetical protein